MARKRQTVEEQDNQVVPTIETTDSLVSLRKLLDKHMSKEKDAQVQLDPNFLRDQLPHISTGSMIIDTLIGGKPNAFGIIPCPGLPKGKIVTLFGASSCGKTTTALMCAAKTTASGGTVIYIDFENEVVPYYAKALGVPIDDPDKFALFQPSTLEEGFRIILAAVAAKVDLIVIDSIAAGVPDTIKSRDIKEVGKSGPVGLIARLWAGFLPELKGALKGRPTVVLGISQTRNKISSGGPASFGADTGGSEQGGEAWKFFAALRIQLTKIRTDYAEIRDMSTNKMEKQAIGSIIQVKMIKNKVSDSQGRKALFRIKQGTGIDDLGSLLEVASAFGIIKKSGAWFSYSHSSLPSELKSQGIDALKKMILRLNNANAILLSIAQELNLRQLEILKKDSQKENSDKGAETEQEKESNMLDKIAESIMGKRFDGSDDDEEDEDNNE